MRIGGKAAFAVSFDAARFALQEMLNGDRTFGRRGFRGCFLYAAGQEG